MVIQQKKSLNSLKPKKFRHYKSYPRRKVYIKLSIKRLRYFQSRVKNKNFLLLKALKTPGNIYKNKTTRSKFWKTKSWAFKFNSRRKILYPISKKITLKNFNSKKKILNSKTASKFNVLLDKLSKKQQRKINKPKKEKFEKGVNKKNKKYSSRKPIKRLF